MTGRGLRATAAVALAALLAAVVLVAAAQTPPTTWTPLSRALEPLGPLVLGGSQIRWSICRNARVAPLGGEKAATVYTLDGQPGCVLDGQRITHLKLAPPARAGGRCEAELSLFTSEKAWRAAQPEAWGLVERAPCP